jgi:hypothetical protein
VPVCIRRDVDKDDRKTRKKGVLGGIQIAKKNCLTRNGARGANEIIAIRNLKGWKKKMLCPLPILELARMIWGLHLGCPCPHAAPELVRWDFLGRNSADSVVIVDPHFKMLLVFL